MSRILAPQLLAFICALVLVPTLTQAQIFQPVPQQLQGQLVSEDYRLGPLDKISVKVFGQDKLSVEKIQIDASGIIILPLVGEVRAGGHTAQEVSDDIARRLGDKYLQNPSVSVLIEEAVSQKVTVSGAVTESGVFNLKGPTTLMQAVAMAKGVDFKIANLKGVTVFRTVDNKRSYTVYDLTAIERGRQSDPEIFGGDTVVIPPSNAKTTWRNFVDVLPGLSIFTRF